MQDCPIIKDIPEDFVVTELGSPQPSGSGPFAYFVLQKRDYGTIDALEAIASKLKIPLKAFGFCGNKDRRAVTMQVCSVKGVSASELERINIPNILITYLGQAGRPVSLGSHNGNNFSITIRNIDSLPKIDSTFLNLYGSQRFSVNNADIGKCLVKKDWKGAIAHLLNDSQRLNRLKKHLEEHPSDSVGALRTLPKKLLMLYLHAYQSKLWNELAESMKDSQEIELPIIGFGLEDNDIKKFPLLKQQLEKEQIKPIDFVVRALPEISAEGGKRKVLAKAEDLIIHSPQEDERHKGKKKVLIEFSLGNGSYATEFMRQKLFCVHQPVSD